VSIVEKDNLVNLIVYPNPTSGVLYVKGLKNVENYILLDVIGRMVKTGNIENKKALDISILNAGTYFIKIQDKMIKFIKD
jgi:hypothetical protein